MQISAEYCPTSEEFTITLKIPKYQTGKWTYGDNKEGEEPDWKMPNIGVYIDRKYCDYTLNHLIYLDYKDSLQTGNAILHFDSEKEALKFAEDYKLMIEYANNGYQD